MRTASKADMEIHVLNCVRISLLCILISLMHPATAFATGEPVSFSTYNELFTFIAGLERLPGDNETLLILAADSTIARATLDGIGPVLVIEPNYYGPDKFNRIRGAQQNGRYFVLTVHGDSLTLVGILHGNAYRWDYTGDSIRVITSWHMSAAESPETTYAWNGTVFEPFERSLK